MKILFGCLCIIFVQACFSQQKINGVGVLQLGESDTEILNALHILPGYIVNGNPESNGELLLSIKNSVVCLRHGADAVQPDTGYIHTAFMGENVPRRCFDHSPDVVFYFLPRYHFNAVGLGNVALVFYQHRLAGINSEFENDNLYHAFRDVFEKAHPDFKPSSNDWSTDEGQTFMEWDDWNSHLSSVKVGCSTGGFLSNKGSNESYHYYYFYAENKTDMDKVKKLIGL